MSGASDDGIDSAAQRTLAKKVGAFLDSLTPAEAALFAASLTAGLRREPGDEGAGDDVRGHNLFATNLVTTAVTTAVPCNWVYLVGPPARLCYVCGGRVQNCIFP